MTVYRIKEGFFLKSASRLLQPGQHITTDDESELAELASFADQGSCEELKSQPQPAEAPAAPAGQPEEDITVVPGVGKKAKDGLEALGIVTVSQLKSRLNEDEVTEVLGKNAGKVAAYFAE